MIKKISISGFRGFGIERTIQFSLPDDQRPGSGLNIITGANNSGKTTIVESIRAFNADKAPSFSEGRRNLLKNGIVKLSITDENDKEYSINSVEGGGSSTKKSSNFALRYYVVQSRRGFSFEFRKAIANKDYYITHTQAMPNQRDTVLEQFEIRIYQIEEKREQFDSIIQRVLGTDFKWTIEQRDNGQYYIKYTQEGITHSSEGVGDGIWSIFTICAALFDAENKTTIIIDEPELSVHPAVQRKLMDLFLEYTDRLQIIICTHSPYFISWSAIAAGAQLIRVVKENCNTNCYCLGTESKKRIKGILEDINNPHVLGLDASEVFFLDDSLILVEGQEDVVIYNKIANQLGLQFRGNFFGWGVGGAPKMKFFISLFKDLGYSRIVAIFDGDKQKDADEIKSEFPDYHVVTIPEADIREKRGRNIPAKSGIANENGDIKDQYKEYIKSMIIEINNYLIANKTAES
ncbi:MAG: AAA family ATPase [Clostridia bacterium]|nr:AAA family ATPase [Clostridia bacterium]